MHMSKAEVVRRVEVFSGTGRRRRWLPEVKARIIAESYGPAATVSGVARRHGLTVQQLFAWRREAMRSAPGRPAFVPVVVACSQALGPLAGTAGPEIVVEQGAVRVRVPMGVDTATLRTVLGVLRELG